MSELMKTKISVDEGDERHQHMWADVKGKGQNE
jgi:hypothetical protein